MRVLHARATCALSIAFLAIAWTAVDAAPLSADQPQPRPTGQRSLPNSIILRGEPHAATMQRLHVLRKYALSDLHTNPQVTLGEARLDFRPMLTNPKALFNVAERVHALPQHV